MIKSEITFETTEDYEAAMAALEKASEEGEIVGPFNVEILSAAPMRSHTGWYCDGCGETDRAKQCVGCAAP